MGGREERARVCGKRVLRLRGANPAWRDWSRRAFGPQLSNKHVGPGIIR